jgi:hypothetical protein
MGTGKPGIIICLGGECPEAAARVRPPWVKSGSRANPAAVGHHYRPVRPTPQISADRTFGRDGNISEQSARLN